MNRLTIRVIFFAFCWIGTQMNVLSIEKMETKLSKKNARDLISNFVAEKGEFKNIDLNRIEIKEKKGRVEVYVWKTIPSRPAYYLFYYDVETKKLTFQPLR